MLRYQYSDLHRLTTPLKMDSQWNAIPSHHIAIRLREIGILAAVDACDKYWNFLVRDCSTLQQKLQQLVVECKNARTPIFTQYLLTNTMDQVKASMEMAAYTKVVKLQVDTMTRPISKLAKHVARLNRMATANESDEEDE